MTLVSSITVGLSGTSDAGTAAAGPPPSATRFQYDAVESRGKRASPVISTASEDWILEASKRAKLTANTRDITRNFSIAAWAVRRHLDYVTRFNFHARTGDPDLDTQIEAVIGEKMKAKEFDNAGRHRLTRFLRISEARRVLDGDIAWLRLANGRIQAIESDRIKNPTSAIGTTFDDWTHGIRTDANGRALEYAIWNRSRQGMKYSGTTVRARDLFLLGYFERFDQLRGISPLTSGINQLRDVYEGLDYALAKSKVDQLFALAFYRDAMDSAGTLETETTEDGAAAAPGYNVDFGKGPVMLDLNPGDKAEFLSSQNPSTQFQEYMQLVLMVALKALDIPFSFFDESHTNFFGSRGAWLHYDRSCQSKTEDLAELLDWYTEWRLRIAILDGEITLPAGKTFDSIDWEWVRAGVPWWDPSKEINGSLLAIRGGLDNPERITKASGGDIYDNIDATARVLKYAREKDVVLSFDPVANLEAAIVQNDQTK